MESCAVSRSAGSGVSMQALGKLSRTAVGQLSANAAQCASTLSSSSARPLHSMSISMAPSLSSAAALSKRASCQAASTEKRVLLARECTGKMQSLGGRLRTIFGDSRSATALQRSAFLTGTQHQAFFSSLHNKTDSRVSATADVYEEDRVAPPHHRPSEELGVEERRPLPRSLPPRTSKDVWVRPGVTPPPETTAVDHPPRREFARPARPPQRFGGGPRKTFSRYDGDRTDENRVKNVRNGFQDWAPESRPAAAPVSEKPAKSVVKKKVALWMGYVGTDFKGSMMQRNQPGPTIEAALEQAIFKSGGMKESNFGDFKKVGWNRSSRTDKGVHALASVVSLKMEVPAEVFVHDPEGLSIADRINQHLPPTIRVYGVQPVTKSFNAYHNCRARTYEYVLPASVIGITDEMDDDAASETIEKLRGILKKYEGRQAFHNFTVRRLYRSGKKGSKRKVTRLTQESETELDLEGSGDELSTTAEPETADAPVSDSERDPSEETSVSEIEALGAHVGSPEIDGSASDDSESDESAADMWRDEGVGLSSTDEFFAGRRENEELELEYDEEELDDDGDWLEKRGPTARWLLETPPDDKIGPSHHRRILSATCTGLEPLGRSRVVRIHIEGESFMLHQIRKMVGAAVGILRGDFPLAMLDAMLACHSRIILPMAPAEGLFLSRTRFFPFRTSFNNGFTDDGPSLELGPALEQAREEFRLTQLLPAMAPLLDAEKEPWTGWLEKLDHIGPVPEEEVTQVISAFEEWRQNAPARGDQTRERPPWFQSAKRPRPTTTRWGARSGTVAGRWTRS